MRCTERLNPFYLDIDFGQIKAALNVLQIDVLILFTWTLISDCFLNSV